MKISLDLKRAKNKNSMEGIQLVYVIFDGIWLVFANKNENWYKAGIQKSLHFFNIKIYGIQSAVQKFWYISGCKQKKQYKIEYQPFYFL